MSEKNNKPEAEEKKPPYDFRRVGKDFGLMLVGETEICDPDERSKGVKEDDLEIEVVYRLPNSRVCTRVTIPSALTTIAGRIAGRIALELDKQLAQKAKEAKAFEAGKKAGLEEAAKKEAAQKSATGDTPEATSIPPSKQPNSATEGAEV